MGKCKVKMCHATQCVHNKNRQCTLENIEISMLSGEPACKQYEEKRWRKGLEMSRNKKDTQSRGPFTDVD
tara:strand:- start:906 stop:1115 length:210 start_codon:yes stop_codon:yes gene_type:complete